MEELKYTKEEDEAENSDHESIKRQFDGHKRDKKLAKLNKRNLTSSEMDLLFTEDDIEEQIKLSRGV